MDTNAAFLDPGARRRLFPAFLMMLSVTFGFWAVATFVPTYVGTVAAKAGLSAPYYSAVAGLLGTGVAIVGFISLGFCADAIGRKPTAMIWYAMCLILTPVVYVGSVDRGAARHSHGLRLLPGGIWAWAPIWLPELFPTRMRGTAVAFCFNAPRWISCVGPLIAGTLIVSLGGDDRRLILHPRCRRGAVPAGDERKTAPRHPVAGSGFGRAAGPHQLIVNAPSRISKLFSRFRKLIPSSETFRFSFTAAATLSIDSCSMRISRNVIGASRARPLAVCER